MILCVSCHYRQNYISYKHRPLIQSGLRSLAPIDLYSTRWNLIFQSCIWSLCCNKKLLEWRLDYMFSSPIPRLYKSYCLFYCLWFIKSCKLLKCFMSRRCNVANAEVLAVDLWLTGARTNRVLWLSHATNEIVGERLNRGSLRLDWRSKFINQWCQRSCEHVYHDRGRMWR